MFTARTLSKIEIDLKASFQAKLPELTFSSEASVEYSLVKAIATEIYSLEVLMEQAFADLKERALEIPVATKRWYQSETLRYQDGDELIVNSNGLPAYPVEDLTKRVVAFSGVSYVNGQLIIKAAKEDTDGTPTELSESELSGLTGYWAKKQAAGDTLLVISIPGDELELVAYIDVDGQVIVSDGESKTVSGTYPVADAIKEYLYSLDFGGDFKVSELIKIVMSVDGVLNINITRCDAYPNTAVTPTDILSLPGRKYTSLAGYMREKTDELLDDTLIYNLL